MMTSDAFARLAGMQDPSGCFPSLVSRGDRSWTDRNGFTAAIVLRTLRDLEHVRLVELKSRALDYVERCRSPEVDRAFAFWPAPARPDWAEGVPADVDDTAVMTTELLRHGRIDARRALETVCHVLLRQRVRASEHHLPWIEAGAFSTWIARGQARNVIDCCVNANVLALLALLDARHLPGYEAALATIKRGLAWAGASQPRLRSLSPFYPSTHDLCEALAHAIACGETTLVEQHRALLLLIGPRRPEADPGCCCSAYGGTVWRCRAIDAARALLVQH